MAHRLGFLGPHAALMRATRSGWWAATVSADSQPELPPFSQSPHRPSPSTPCQAHPWSMTGSASASISNSMYASFDSARACSNQVFGPVRHALLLSRTIQRSAWARSRRAPRVAGKRAPARGRPAEQERQAGLRRSTDPASQLRGLQLPAIHSALHLHDRGSRCKGEVAAMRRAGAVIRGRPTKRSTKGSVACPAAPHDRIASRPRAAGSSGQLRHDSFRTL